MRKKFVVANWKMHTTAAAARRLATAVVDGVGTEDRVSVAVCPPFPYLALVGEILKGSRVASGRRTSIPRRKARSPVRSARRCSSISAASTSSSVTASAGTHWANPIRSSTRRYGLPWPPASTSSSASARPWTNVEADETEAVLDRQLIQGLAGLSADTLTRLTIAYEPVWAIGNLGHHATPEQAQQAHAVIRRRFGQMFDEKSAQTLVIQYGGSVKPENAAALLGRHGVDGALIGGASLNAEQFLAIVRAGISESQTERDKLDDEHYAPVTTRVQERR